MKMKRSGSISSSTRRAPSPRLAGLVVPPRVRTALKFRPVDAESLQAGLLGLAQRFACDADARSLSTADDLVTLVSDALAIEPVEQGAFALRLFVLIVPYFDRVGRPDVSLRMARHVTTCAASWPGSWARRCAHQFAAAVSLRTDDSRQAWAHAECAYALAAGFETSSGRFETLVLVVGILDNMGLLREGRTLALQLLDHPEGGASFDALHLLNAVNGLSLCDRLDDLRTASRFCEVAMARAAQRSASDLDALGARYEAARAHHLVRTGSARSAARRIDEALSRSPKHEPCVEAILRSAQIEVYAVIDDQDRVDSSLDHLKKLLPTFHGDSAFHRELLRNIVRCELRRGGEDNAVALRYLELLRERPSPAGGEWTVGIDALLQSLLLGLVDGMEGSSTGTDARPFQEVATRDFARDPWRGRRFADFGLELPDTDATAAVLTLPEREAALRTPAFEVAENWAVVAEIAMGGDGRQCFKVGRIAAGLAAALGLSDERTVLIELACRLRNIGDATIACRPFQSKPAVISQPGIAEHTQAGSRILSFSSDPVLRSAARIVGNHHAWWNGDGVPAGLRGDDIPLEARICAVADQLISLVDPIGARRPWPIETAIRQLRCMAGVQLDPELVDLLSLVLHDEGMRVEDAAWKLLPTSWNDPFNKARKHWIETLESAV